MSYNKDYAPLDTLKRYHYCRDRGHLEFMKKFRRCEQFFLGEQWTEEDRQLLAQTRRPALTINKIMPTVANVVGEQLYNRAMISYRPAKDATQEVADALSLVFMHISQRNRLPWVRTDVFTDGVVGSRGFYDVRLDFDQSLMGEIKISRVNPMHVMLDPESSGYCTKDWSDVLVTRWHTLDEIALMYGKSKAKQLQSYPTGYTPYDFPGDDLIWDSYGDEQLRPGWHYAISTDEGRATRRVRVIERQHRVLQKIEYLVDIETGDMRPRPEGWDDERVGMFLEQNPSIMTLEKQGFKIRWDVVASDVVLHSEWSPYSDFTIVPYFPYFRSGRTSGIVEHLLGPQELFNKIRSQELHVVNTSANSGWITEEGNLVNMSVEELERRGAESGVVLTVNDKDRIEKIQPNQVPTGLDRLSYKSEEDIKTISGVTDYMAGSAREDVSAKAVRLNQSRGSAAFATLLDNLNRTDTMLAERVLSLVQNFYTEPRLLNITGNGLGQESQQVAINQPGPEGEIINDMTLGTYDVVVTSESERDSQEDSQFDHAVALRTEVGVQIPDEFMIETSKLRNKSEILETMRGNQTPEKQAEEEEMARQMAQAELQKLVADGTKTTADARLIAARAAEVEVNIRKTANEPGEGQKDLSPEEMAKAQLKAMEQKQKADLDRENATHDFLLRMRELRLSHELEMKKQAAAPKPQPTGAGNE